MKHLEYAFDGKNQIWRYIVLLALVFIISNTIGSIPLAVMIGISVVRDGAAEMPENIMDFSAYGIDQNVGFAAIMFAFMTALIGFILLLRPMHNRNLKGIINGGAPIRWNHLFSGFVLWGAFILLSFLITYLMVPGNITLQLDLKSFIPLFFITLLMVPFQTSFEEITFRGYLMQGVATRTRSRIWSLISVAVAFGLMHSMNPEVKELGFFLAMPQYIMMGLLLGVVTVLDDGIEVALGIHAANNMVTALVYTNESSAFQTPSVFLMKEMFAVSDLIQVTVFSIVFVIILKARYKWNWHVLKQKVEPEIMVQKTQNI